MYLKKLEAQGFKSFADKTELNFKHGITAIVGPNGSGKSNISDAIRWVMGEQSAKSLRGSNMQDVIFAGTQRRKAVGFAEVSLTIDNSTGILPSEYSEITVTRRVYRSGESEYYINRTSCRLKDVHELLMDTGLGRDGYSIISQGKIDEILSVRSEDRRQIFEEAAGISKYRYRKEEAERKLSHTEDNLSRIGDIILELEAQLEPLKLQSERAKRFLTLREELKVLEVNTFLEGLDRYRGALNDVTRVYDSVNEQAQGVSGEIEAIEQEIQDLYEKSKMSDLQAEDFRQREAEARQMQSSFLNEIELFKNKIVFCRQTHERLADEMIGTEQKIDELRQLIAQSGTDANELTEQQEKLNSELERINAELMALEESSQRDLSKIETLQADIIEGINAVSELRARLGNIHTLRGSYENRAFHIEEDLVQKNAVKQSREKHLQEVGIRLEDNTKLLSGLQDTIKQSEQEVIRLRGMLSEDLSKQRMLETEFSEKSARLKMLSDMEKDFEGYSRSVKNIMQAGKSGELKGVTLYGTVAQLIDVPKKYAIAIETALGGSMQFIVTENESDAKEAINYLKKRSLGRATFLPVSVASGNVLNEQGLAECEGYIGLASELVGYDDKYDGAVKSLLGRIVIVDHIDHAIKIAKKCKYKFRIVTLEGELLAPGGSMTGGSQNRSSGIFTRANERKELFEQVKEAQKGLHALKEEIDKGEQDLRILEQKNAAQLVLMQDAEQAKVRILTEMEHHQSALVEIKGSIVGLSKEQEEIARQMQGLDQDAEQIKLAIGQKEGEMEESRLLMDALKLGSTGVADQREKVQSEQLTLRMRISDLQKDLAMMEEKNASLHSQINAYTITLEAKRAEMESAKEDIIELESDIEFKEQQIKDQDELLEELIKAVTTAVEDRRGADEDVKERQRLAKEKMEQLMKIQQEVARLESKKEKAEIEMENIINKLWDEYELTLTAAEEYRREIGSFNKAQRRVNEIKNEIKNLGNINIDAIEEYKNVKERFEFLDAQKNDLTGAKQNLEKIIRDMQSIMKKQFAEQFQIINEEFNSVFAELFVGGYANLRLVDPSDVLQSGIEIDVQPSGKQVQNMLLLSGGEKALTAIALLLAILRVRPTPFCILDEIDAALDDVNVTRYANYIKQFSKKTQFILITHKRGTMESSDMLYGITMQEKGISSVLALNLEEVNV